MSRRPKGHQRTWTRTTRPCPFLWPWQGALHYRAEEAEDKLALLKRVWTSSRNYAALFDALQIMSASNVACAWAASAAREALGNPGDVKRWGRRHRRDLIDVARANLFEEARDPEVGLNLSRVEAAQFAADFLVGTIAATSRDAVLKLIPRMQRNDAREFGRYYLGAGSLSWDTKYLSRTSSYRRSALVWKWRRRAAARGSVTMQEAEAFGLKYLRQCIARGDTGVIETMKLYERTQREDKITR